MRDRATESGNYEEGDCNGKDLEPSLSKKNMPEHLKIPHLEGKVEPRYPVAPTAKPDNHRPQAKHGARAAGPLPL